MRTPKEAFDDMCSCHGEVWALTDNGWSCIRKSEHGARSVHWNSKPPLGVFDLLKHTGCTFALFNTLTGHLEVLVSKVDKAKLEEVHTPEQLLRESERRLAQKVERKQVIHAVMEKIRTVGRHAAEDMFDLELGKAHGNKHDLN